MKGSSSEGMVWAISSHSSLDIAMVGGVGGGTGSVWLRMAVKWSGIGSSLQDVGA